MGGLGQRKKGPELLNLSQVCLKISTNQVIIIIIIITSTDACPVPCGLGLAEREGARALTLPGGLALRGLNHE